MNLAKELSNQDQDKIINIIKEKFFEDQSLNLFELATILELSHEEIASYILDIACKDKKYQTQETLQAILSIYPNWVGTKLDEIITEFGHFGYNKGKIEEAIRIYYSEFNMSATEIQEKLNIPITTIEEGIKIIATDDKASNRLSNTVYFDEEEKTGVYKCGYFSETIQITSANIPSELRLTEIKLALEPSLVPLSNELILQIYEKVATSLQIAIDEINKQRYKACNISYEPLKDTSTLITTALGTLTQAAILQLYNANYSIEQISSQISLPVEKIKSSLCKFV